MEKKKILIVDDDQGTTLSFKLGLENSGYSVDTFNDPEIALNNFKPGIYDLATCTPRRRPRASRKFACALAAGVVVAAWSAVQAQGGDAAAGRTKAQTCATCHGPSGI